MSQNLSLKKVVPYLRSYSVARNGQTVPSSFDKHFVYKDNTSSEQEEADSQEGHEGNFSEPKKTKGNNLPEIFKLVENPNLNDLFELSNGKKEQIRKLIVRRLRQERGVSDRLPISYTNALKLNKNEIYRRSIEWYYNHKYSSILFSM